MSLTGIHASTSPLTGTFRPFVVSLALRPCLVLPPVTVRLHILPFVILSTKHVRVLPVSRCLHLTVYHYRKKSVPSTQLSTTLTLKNTPLCVPCVPSTVPCVVRSNIVAPLMSPTSALAPSLSCAKQTSPVLTRALTAPSVPYALTPARSVKRAFNTSHSTTHAYYIIFCYICPKHS